MPTQDQCGFGRRKPGAPLPVMKKISRPAAPAAALPAASLSVDDEIRRWKKARRYSLPWKPLALMGSLCFGVASFVLPNSINDQLQYPLYALSAASLYAGFRRKR